MKTNNFIPSLSREEGVTVLTLQLKVADKENDAFFSDRIRPEDVLRAYKQVIIDSVKARMDACTRNLVSHQDDIFSANESFIEYARKNKCTKRFNIRAFQAMEDVVRNFEYDGYAMFFTPTTSHNELMHRALMISEIQKSLYFYPERPDVDIYCFSDLIDVLSEILEMSMMESQKLA